MFANTTGGSNVGIGQDTMKVNTTGANNTAVGQAAFGSNTTGASNTALGKDALVANTTGTDNVGVGRRALCNVTTGLQNTAVGRTAGKSLTTGNNNIYIGYETEASSSGVGTSIAIGIGIQDSGGNSVTIGSGSGVIYNNFTSNATWTQASDRRLKNNIQNDTLGLSFINQLNPVTYNWKPSNEIDKNLPYYKEVNEKDVDITMHGLIAQEVKEALDIEGVDTFAGWDKRNDGIQVISREMFISPLINAIKELKAEIDELKKK